MMNALSRLFLCGGVVAVVACGLGLTQSQRLKQLGAEMTRLPAPTQFPQQRVEPRPEDDLEGRLIRVLARNKFKLRVVRQLITGRLALRDAADHLRDLDEELPWCSPMPLATLFPNCSPLERYCRHLIELVRSELEDRQADREEVVARLEKELQSLRDGGLFNQTMPITRPPNPVSWLMPKGLNGQGETRSDQLSCLGPEEQGHKSAPCKI
jgi:hypothetical protein